MQKAEPAAHLRLGSKVRPFTVLLNMFLGFRYIAEIREADHTKTKKHHLLGVWNPVKFNLRAALSQQASMGS